MTPSEDYASGNHHAIRVVKQSRIGAQKWKITKKASIWATNLNVFEKRISEAGIFTWSHGFFNILKSENGIKFSLWFEMFRKFFGPKVQKREPQTLWFTMFPERVFGKWKCWLGVTEFYHFQKWKTASQKPGKTKGLGLHFRPRITWWFPEA